MFSDDFNSRQDYKKLSNSKATKIILTNPLLATVICIDPSSAQLRCCIAKNLRPFARFKVIL